MSDFSGSEEDDGEHEKNTCAASFLQCHVAPWCHSPELGDHLQGAIPVKRVPPYTKSSTPFKVVSTKGPKLGTSTSKSPPQPSPSGLRAGKKQYTQLFVAENGPFGAPFFDPKNHPKKFMWVQFLRSFPGNEAHQLFFSGGPKWGGLGGGPKSLCWKSLCAFSVP